MTHPVYIYNSLDLIKKLSGIHIPEKYSLISLNVTSLFTNVPLDLVNDILKRKMTLHFVVPLGATRLSLWVLSALRVRTPSRNAEVGYGTLYNHTTSLLLTLYLELSYKIR